MSGKEIVNISDGSRLGVLGQTDLNINKKTGKIESLIIPSYKWFGFKQEEHASVIKWNKIKKIGKELILIDFDYL